jgi:hypothetical protein
VEGKLSKGQWLEGDAGQIFFNSTGVLMQHYCSLCEHLSFYTFKHNRLMMKHASLLFFMSLVMANVSFTQPLPIRITSWQTFSAAEPLLPLREENLTYDANGRLSVTVVRRFDTDNWVNDWRTQHTYNAEGRLVELLSKRPDGPNWVDSFRVQSTYTNPADILPSERLSQWFNDNTQQWVNALRELTTYNADFQPLNYTAERWDLGLNSWLPNAVASYQYDANGNQTVSEFLLFDQSTPFGIRQTSGYDAANRQVSLLYELQNDGVWESNSRYFYDHADDDIYYDSYRLEVFDVIENQWAYTRRGFATTDTIPVLESELILQDSLAAGWTNYLRIRTKYNTEGAFEQFEQSIWDTNTWRTDLFFQVIFNPDNSVDSTFTRQFDSNAQELFLSQVNKLEYAPVSTRLPTLSATIRAYPNPVVDQVRIDISDALPGQTLWAELLDANNRVIAQRRVQGGQASFPMAQYAAGVYFVRVISATGMQVLPIVKR